MRNLSVKFPITRSGRDRSSSITHTFHIPCNYWCLTWPVPALPTTNECKNPNWQVQTCRNSISSQNDHLSIKEIQNSIFILRIVSLYTHKISKLLSLGVVYKCLSNQLPITRPDKISHVCPGDSPELHTAQWPLTRLGRSARAIPRLGPIKVQWSGKDSDHWNFSSHLLERPLSN